MDGENHGNPYEQMDDLGGKTPYFWKHPNMELNNISNWLINRDPYNGLL